LGWGDVNVHTVAVGSTGERRRLDIVDITNSRGVEVKSGYTSATKEVLSELRRDKLLKDEEGWDIEWHFDGKPTAPLLRALDEAGIRWTIRDNANLPRNY